MNEKHGPPVDIRPLDSSRRAEAIALIWDTFREFEAPDYTDEGVRAFRDYIEDEAALESLEFFGAFVRGRLEGVIALDGSGRHICLFFVRAGCQRQGIGRRLWEHVLSVSPHGAFTVNSSPFAVPVYRRLGFAPTDGELVADGMRYTPMRFIRTPRPAPAAAAP